MIILQSFDDISNDLKFKQKKRSRIKRKNLSTLIPEKRFKSIQFNSMVFIYIFPQVVKDMYDDACIIIGVRIKSCAVDMS